MINFDFEQLLEKAKERMRQEFQKTEDKRFREEHKRLSREFKKKKAEIKQQAEQDNKELQNKSEQELKQKKKDQLNDLKKKFREKEDEMQKTIDKLNEETKLNEMIIETVGVQEMRLALLKAVYSTTMGSKVDFTNDSELVIDLSEDKGKKKLEFIIFCIIS